MKRKFLALILAALCATTSSVCFTACNANDDGKGSDNTENNQPEITELQEYDLSGISFNDKSITYDGNFHSIEIVGDLPQGVSVSYTGGGTNAGEYTVTAKFAGDTVTHKPIADITAKLTITKAPFTGEISFSGAQFDYDGEAHNIILTGDLPEGIFVSYEYNNEAGETVAPENVKEIGEYTVTAVFTSENYQPISSLTAVLKIVGESLYDESGNLNYAVFANTIKDWMNDGYFSSQLLLKPMQGIINDIDYVSTKEVANKITFGAYISCSLAGKTTSTYQTFIVESETLINKLLNAEFDNTNELTSYLNTLDKPITLGAGVQYESTTKYASGQEKSDLFTMAENILKRLKEVGYQGGSIKNEGTKVSDYAGARILSVRKTKDFGGNSAFDMGPVYWAYFYVTIQKENGEKEILTFDIAYRSNGASQNILDPDFIYATGSNLDTGGKWIILQYSSKEIDYCPYA